jgi:histone H3/H4
MHSAREETVHYWGVVCPLVPTETDFQRLARMLKEQQQQHEEEEEQQQPETAALVEEEEDPLPQRSIRRILRQAFGKRSNSATGEELSTLVTASATTTTTISSDCRRVYQELTTATRASTCNVLSDNANENDHEEGSGVFGNFSDDLSITTMTTTTNGNNEGGGKPSAIMIRMTTSRTTNL